MKAHNYVILGSLFLWFSAFIYVPVLPIYSKDLGANLQFIGIIMGSYAVGQIIFRIPIGYLSDRLKSRKLFSVLSSIVSFLGAAYLFISNNPNDILLGRILTGVGAAGWVSISVYYSSFFPKNERFKSSASILASGILGIFLGSIVSGYISDLLGIKACFLISMISALFSTLLFLISKEKPFDIKSQFSTLQFISLLSNKLLICLCLIGILIQFINWSINFSYFPIYLNGLGYSDSIVGNVIASFTLANFIGILSSPYIFKRFRFLKIFIFSAILISATTLIVPYFENLILLIALRILNGLSVGALLAYCSSSIVRGFQENYQASAMGIYQSLFSVGIFLGPILSGLIGSQINLASVFILSSFISLLLIPVSFFMKSKEFAI